MRVAPVSIFLISPASMPMRLSAAIDAFYTLASGTTRWLTTS
jgi:hypothetical protein